MIKVTLINSITNDVYETPEDQKKITIGRNKEFCSVNDIGIPDFPEYKEVSKRHCTLYIENDELYVADEGSKNGTYVDGKQLEKGEKKLLRNGSRLWLSIHYELKIKIRRVGIEESLDREGSTEYLITA